MPLFDNNLITSIEPFNSGAKVTIPIFSRLPYVSMRFVFSSDFILDMLCAPTFLLLMKGPSTCAPKIAAPSSSPQQRLNFGKI